MISFMILKERIGLVPSMQGLMDFPQNGRWMERFGFENRYIPRLPDIPLVPGRDLKICLTLSPEPGCDRLRGKIDLHALLNNLVKV